MGKPETNGCSPWAVPGRVERLKVLWEEGLSCSRIAREFGDGITRNAVIGKVHRLGLEGRSPDTSVKRKNYVRSKPIEKVKAKPVEVKVAAPKPEFRCLPGTTTGDTKTCQYIEGDTNQPGWQMCGQPGYPWCSFHRPIVFDLVRTAAYQKKFEEKQAQYDQRTRAA